MGEQLWVKIGTRGNLHLPGEVGVSTPIRSVVSSTSWRQTQEAPARRRTGALD
jgi:hypothetical protein